MIPIRRVAVIGAGTMGSGIAQVAAQAGYDVTLHDSSPGALERARSVIDQSLAKLVQKATITDAVRVAAMARLTFAVSLDSIASADLIVEAITEDRGAKREQIGRCDRIQ
jgi:3-hydroxybutyryl-CoA dehydrogenase